MKLVSLTAALFVFTATMANAQVSLDELDAQVSARDKELAAFADRLNDPDPEKSLAAMKLLIEKGDADQQRMAIRFGLYSPDLAIRSTVLRAIFNSSPTLVVNMKPVSEKQGVYFEREIRRLNGSYLDDSSVSVVFKVAGYNDDEACWFYKSGVYEPCLVRLTADTVSVFIGDSWSQYTLNAQGVLTGTQNVKGEVTEATISLAE